MIDLIFKSDYMIHRVNYSGFAYLYEKVMKYL